MSSNPLKGDYITLKMILGTKHGKEAHDTDDDTDMMRTQKLLLVCWGRGFNP